jgi:hypothetical protein
VHGFLSADHQAYGVFMKDALSLERPDGGRIIMEDQIIICILLIWKNILWKIMNHQFQNLFKKRLIGIKPNQP